MTDEPRLQAEPREGVPDVIDTLPAFREYCSALASSHGSLAADAERASGFRYGHDDWLVQFKRDGAGIGLLDPQALTAEGVDWNDFNAAVGDAVWILHDSLQDLPGFNDLGLKPQRLFDTEIAARLLGMKRFGLAAVTEHYLGLTLAKEHSAADWSYRPLPRDWRNYAALDVELLIELETIMRAELRRQGKIEWAEEEFDYALREGTAPRKEHPVPWLRISHITEIMKDRQALAVAKALWTKRDELRANTIFRQRCCLPTEPSSKWRSASRTMPHNSGRCVPSTNVCASKPTPNRRKCSNATRPSNAKSSQACGRK